MSRKREKIYIGAILAFFYIPILSLVIFSFNSGRSLMNFEGFSFRWYRELLFDPTHSQLTEAITNTIVVAIAATFISTVIGTLAAVSLTKTRKSVRNVVFNLNNLPILNPEIITAVGLLLVFTTFAIDRGLLTMLLAHIAFCTPYVIITVYPRLKSLDPNLIEAACDLGAHPWKALRKVIFPEIKPSIIAAAMIAFTMSFDDFIISLFTAGNNQNISIYLYGMRFISPIVNALSTIILVFIFTIVITHLVLQKKKQKQEETKK